MPLPRTGAGKPLQWRPEWSRFDHWDAVLSAVAGASTLTTAIVKPIAPFRQGGVLFDEGARSALRAPSYNSRGTARDVSDVLLALSLTTPFLVDSLTVAYWYRGSSDVAAEMALIDAETFLVTGAVQGLFTTFTARERPYGRTCGGDTPSDTIDCDSNDRYRSFFSGHSAFAFASASLTCSHHLTLDLFDSRPADIGACVTMYTAAAATATLRVVGDKHYASDVIVGSAVGAAMGFAVPYFLHYRKPKQTSLTVEPASTFRWHVLPSTSGGSIVGVF
ncbi:MAG: phosphatase PAP2 family protein [Myxococcales bacterium]|nr:MAG: phosphatase PAP2 family protein [Myxococcales bacterium]